MTATPHLDTPDTASGVLDAVREQHQIEAAATVEKFRLAVQWAIMHPAESIVHAATVDGTECELAIAGPGAPLVAEFCVAELALALGVSTDSGKRYLGDAVETHYRLPRLWARVMAGEVPVWKARQVATRTIGLSARRRLRSWTVTSPRSRTAAPTPRSTGPSRKPVPGSTPTKPKRSAPKPPNTATSPSASVTSPPTGWSTSKPPRTSPTPSPSKPTSSAKAHQLLEAHPDLPLDVRRSMALGHLGG